MDDDQHTDEAQVKTTVRIPRSVVNALKEAGKRHHRTFNSELIVALETYLEKWQTKF
jgi:Arc-like DNA binding domain